jgi:hypothetical protein
MRRGLPPSFQFRLWTWKRYVDVDVDVEEVHRTT